MELSKKEILNLFELLNKELEARSTKGELYLVGGAVMCLAFDARDSTQDVDALFKPKEVVREAAISISKKENLKEDWLNDAVKGFFSENASFSIYLEHSNLKVYCASPEYLLSMKCLAMRIGEGFHDLDDVRYLLRYLNVSSYKKALEIITKYYPADRFPQKTLYALEELIEGS